MVSSASLTALVVTFWSALAFAQAPAPVEPVNGAVPAPTEAKPAPAADSEAATALAAPPLAATLAGSEERSGNVSYGLAWRLRWVSVPKWMLNLFTKKNVPLSSYATAIEFFRRKGEFDFIMSLGYQNMSPPDGNWLGRGHDASIDTDFVQFKGLGFWSIDASFVWHSFFTDWFGMHYGAGLGLGIMRGQMLRTSNGGCTEGNAGNVADCHPTVCTSTSCTDAQLAPTQGTGVDDPTDSHRFVDPNVPPALPIVNVVVGVDFRLPRVRGWEAKLEGGFYNAFFMGGGVGYTF